MASEVMAHAPNCVPLWLKFAYTAFGLPLVLFWPVHLLLSRYAPKPT